MGKEGWGDRGALALFKWLLREIQFMGKGNID